jgi:hypothetical protein
MHQPICRDRATVLLIVFLVSVFAGTPTPSTAASERDAQAMTLLQGMAEISFDVVQGSGEKLEFGETRQIVIRRPDRR